MPSKLPIVGAACVLVLAAGCSSGAAAGSVTGIAAPCTGPVLPPQYAKLSVKVKLSQDSHVVQSQTVRGRHLFEFTVTPGKYVLSSNQGLGSPPIPVTVTSGRVTTANISSSCK